MDMTSTSRNNVILAYAGMTRKWDSSDIKFIVP
jgi:hypothetical protein